MLDSSKYTLEDFKYTKISQECIIDKNLETKADKKKYIGKIFKSNKYGEFKILGVDGKNNSPGIKLYVCEFIDTSFIKSTGIGNILKGSVQDYLMINLYGIACSGLVEKPTTHPIYKSWEKMIKRCYYEPSLKAHPTYKDATIDDRWLRFEYFLDDLMGIPGFRECVENNCNNIQIDKDILIYGNKIYSKDTCMFVPNKINSFFINDKTRKPSTGYIGVEKRTEECSIKKYRSKISLDTKVINLGGYTTAREAYEVYHKAKKKILEDYIKEFNWLPDKIKVACRQYLDIQYNDIISRNA